MCYGSGNTYTWTTANSIYNSAQITVERKARDVTFLAAYTFAKGLDDSSAFNDFVNFVESKDKPRPFVERHPAQFRG